MKKLTYAVLGGFTAFFAIGGLAWVLYNPSAETLNHTATAAGTENAAAIPATPASTTPSTTPAPNPVENAVPVTPQAPESQAPASSGDQALTTESQAPRDAATDLNQSMAESEFQKKLSFTLTEEKMRAFVLASNRVQRINSKYDVQIAGAQSDQMAIEYNNFAVEEISLAMKSMKAITLEQYNELTQLTVQNQEFNNLYHAYKQMIQEEQKAAKEKASSATVKEAAPGAVVKTPEAPANPGTASAPQGSPALQDSQPASR